MLADGALAVAAFWDQAPVGLGDLGEPILEGQAIFVGELFDTLEDVSYGLTHIESS